MKKRVLRELRKLSEEVIGKKETDKIVKEVIEETKPKKGSKK